MEKELEKLADLEFEYNLARITKQSPEIIKVAKGKYTKQLNKLLRKQQCEELLNKTQEK